MSENTSWLKPLGRAVLCEPYEPERKASLIALPDFVRERQQVLDLQVRVVEVGPACWPDEPARARPGDIVMVAAFSGHMAKGPKDGNQYRLVNDRDIFC